MMVYSIFSFIFAVFDFGRECWRRILAFLIDYLLIVTMVVLVAKPLITVVDQYLPMEAAIVVHGLFWIALISISARFEASSYRTTPGKYVFGLVVNNKKGTQLSIPLALSRNTLKLLISPVTYVYIPMVFLTSESTKLLLDNRTQLYLAMSIIFMLILNVTLLGSKGRTVHDLLTRTSVDKKNGLKGKINAKKVIGSKSMRFLSHKDAEIYGELLLTREMESLKSQSVIFEYGSTENLLYKNSNFQVDNYALVPGVGILLIEVKYYSGVIKVSGHDYWDIRKKDLVEPKKNPCIQLERTMGLFANLLSDYGLYKWPVIPVVLIAHPNAMLRHEKPDTSYPVLELHELEEWITGQEKRDSIAFYSRDHGLIAAALKRHEKPFEGKKDGVAIGNSQLPASPKS